MAITTNAQGLLIQALVLDFAGVGLLGTVDAVSRVETRTQQFLLALTVASVHRGNHIIEVDRLFLLLAFHLVKDCLFSSCFVRLLMHRHQFIAASGEIRADA